MEYYPCDISIQKETSGGCLQSMGAVVHKAVEEFESNGDYDCGCVYNVERDEWAPDCAEEDDDE